MLMEEFQDVGAECIQSVSWRCRCGYTFHSSLYLFCSVLACSVTASTPFMCNVICHIFAWFAYFKYILNYYVWNSHVKYWCDMGISDLSDESEQNAGEVGISSFHASSWFMANGCIWLADTASVLCSLWATSSHHVILLRYRYVNIVL